MTSRLGAVALAGALALSAPLALPPPAALASAGATSSGSGAEGAGAGASGAGAGSSGAGAGLSSESAAAARRTAAEILSERRFGTAPLPNPVGSAFDKVGRWLGKLAAGAPGGPAVFWGVVAAIVLALTGVGVRRTMRRLDPLARARPSQGPIGRRDARVARARRSGGRGPRRLRRRGTAAVQSRPAAPERKQGDRVPPVAAEDRRVEAASLAAVRLAGGHVRADRLRWRTRTRGGRGGRQGRVERGAQRGSALVSLESCSAGIGTREPAGSTRRGLSGSRGRDSPRAAGRWQPSIDELTPASSGPTSSSYATSADGLAGYADLLTAAGHDVTRLRVAPAPGDARSTRDGRAARPEPRAPERRRRAAALRAGRWVADRGRPRARRLAQRAACGLARHGARRARRPRPRSYRFPRPPGSMWSRPPGRARGAIRAAHCP